MQTKGHGKHQSSPAVARPAALVVLCCDDLPRTCVLAAFHNWLLLRPDARVTNLDMPSHEGGSQQLPLLATCNLLPNSYSLPQGTLLVLECNTA